MAQTTNDNTIEEFETRVGHDKKRGISFDASNPRITPRMPPGMAILLSSDKLAPLGVEKDGRKKCCM